MLDLIIEHGTVVDGTGQPRFAADIGVQDGRVVHVGRLHGATARSRIDATGHIVAPGFIDAHTHDDLLLMEAAAGSHPKLSQGVTTVVTGNCGISLAPLVSASTPVQPLSALGAEHWRFDSFGSYLDALEASRPALNAVCLVGHTTLRVRHLDDLQRPATAHEVHKMAVDLEEALEAGAWGLSTGLYYPPANAATAEEVIGVGAPLRELGGVIAMHIRDEGDAIDDALREALAIGGGIGVPTILSHHKLMGKRNHGRSPQTLAMIEAAARAQPVCMDCYPYNASSTMLRPEMLRHSEEVLVAWSGAEPSAAGRSVFAMAKERGVTPEQLAESLRPAGGVYFAMSEEDVARILAHPLTMVGSDGLAHDARPHPRLWGTFPRVLGHYVRERRLLTLETAVHKMTGLPARRFGLGGRGQLAPGFAADLVVFDAERVQDRATFDDPMRPAVGIRAVFVNGRLACSEGETVDGHAGRVLRRLAR